MRQINSYVPVQRQASWTARTTRRLCFVALAAVAGIGPTSAVAADDAYPSRVITIVVPYPAGNPPDQYVRLFAQKLRAVVGQSVVVENRPGASTTLGTGYVARAKPDGYTIVFGSNSSLAAAPFMFKSLQYDPVRSFSAIAVTQHSSMVLVGRPEDAGGLAGKLRQMKAEPGKHPIGGGAITQEVINKLLQTQAGIDQTYVPYNNANMVNDVLGGRLSMAITTLPGVAKLVDSGQLQVFAIAYPSRLEGRWKGIPTIAETLPGFELTTWSGFWVPAGTPRNIVNYLHTKTTEVLRDPGFARQNEESGARTAFVTPEDSDAFVRSEIPRWGLLLKSVGIEPQ